MTHPVKNGNIGQYYIKFNHFLARFFIFDRVFREFAETSVRIESRDCLVAENLPALKCDWERNFHSFNYFIQSEIPAVPSRDYQDFQESVYQILKDYANAQRQLINAIDDEAERIHHDQVQLAEGKIRECKSRINDALQQIVTVSFG